MTEKRPKLLLIAYLFPPVGGGGVPGSQRAVKLIKFLQGYDVTVLTVREKDYPSLVELNFRRKLPVRNESIVRTGFRNPFDYLLRARSAVRRMLSGPGGAPLRQPPPVEPSRSDAAAKPSLLQRCLDYVHALCHFPDGASGWILPAVLAGRKLIKSGEISAILATGSPWSSLIIAWLLHKLTGVPYIVDFRDPWIGNPFHTSRGALLDTLESYLERQVVKGALLVSVNTEELKVEMLARYRGVIAAEKVLVVTNGFDPDDFARLPSASPAPLPRAGSEPLVLAHAGLLYGVRDPAPFLEAICQLERSGELPADSFRFVQMGNISLQYDLRDRFRELISRGVLQDLGSLSVEECHEELGHADVLLLIQPGTKSQVPSKLYDYLCLDLPIVTITPLDGALANLLRANQFGDVFAPEDLAGIASRLRELWAEKAARGRIRVHYVHRERFNIEKIVWGLEQRMNAALLLPQREESRCLPLQP